MSQNQRSPTQGTVLNTFGEVLKRQIRIALPCSVQAYDPVTQTVDVQPLVSDQLQNEDGTFSPFDFPVVPHVPVAFPGAGGFRITFPIQKGDTGQLLVNDLSIDLWKQQGGKVQPPDQRRHHLSDAVFYPGLHPDNKAWTGAQTADMTVGSDSGPKALFKSNQIHLGVTNPSSPAADAVALASIVLSALQAIVNTYNVHSHPGNGQPTGSQMGAPANPASAIVKSN